MSQWKTLNSKDVFHAGFFRLREDRCELPDGRVMPSYYVFDFADWVNVVALTEDRQVVLLKQHRHAAEQDFLEIPGGSTDPRSGEDAQTAAARELLEETGHEAREWISCGSLYPNPALQSNRLHVFVALGCKKVAELNLDPYEDLEVVTMPLTEMTAIWENGGFTHALIAASIGRTFETLRERGLL